MKYLIDDNGTLREMTKDEIDKIKADEKEFMLSMGYDEAVNHLIRTRYSESAEFSVLRKRETHTEEFEEYNAFCEECKESARAIFSESEGE